MKEIPWFPDYAIEMCNNDHDSWMTDSAIVRLTFRVPRDQLEEVLSILRRTEDVSADCRGFPQLKVVDQ